TAVVNPASADAAAPKRSTEGLAESPQAYTRHGWAPRPVVACSTRARCVLPTPGSPLTRAPVGRLRASRSTVSFMRTVQGEPPTRASVAAEAKEAVVSATAERHRRMKTSGSTGLDR